MSITWRNKMTVGEPMIDIDHKRLIELINSYENAVGSKDLDLLKSTFEGLLKYTETHFSREENLMRAIHYRGYREHKDAHQKLIEELQKFHNRIIYKDGHISLPEVSRFLHDWLINHVLEEDMKMKPLFEGGLHRKPDMSWQ